MQMTGRWILRGSTVVVLGVDSEADASSEEPLAFEVLSASRPVLRRGATGSAVRDLQARLRANGFDPGPIDGIFGPLTESATMSYQRAHHLIVDGIVGAQTWSALDTAPQAPGYSPPASPPPRPSPPPRGSSIGELALAEARNHIDVREDPPGSNRTPFGVWFGLNEVAWCGIFVSYCFKVGAGYTIADNFSGPGVQKGKGCAYVPTIEAWLRATGKWLGRVPPRPGDIAIFGPAGAEPHHTGIVSDDLGNGRFKTIEGNAGDRVEWNEHSLTEVHGFGRITR